MNERFIVFCLIAFLLVISSLVVGFTCGFGGFLLYVATIALFTWLYGWLVVSRPRYAVAGVFEWQYFGSREFYMEVA